MPILLRLLCAAVLLLAAAAARAEAGPLVLDARTVDAWPAVRALEDPAGRLALAEALRQRTDFLPPQVPRANFGPRTGAVWLYLPLQPARGDGRWVLEIDYPPLHRVDVHHLRDGVVVAAHRLGSSQAFAARPLKSRAHAVALDLAPGHRHELLLRVETTTTMVVPIALVRADDFVAHESSNQILQGLLFGITLTLLAYSLANGMSLREPLFVQYAVMVLGITLFLVSFNGIGQQYLWTSQEGLVGKLAPLAILVASVGGNLFVGGALGIAQRRPRVLLALRWSAVLSGLAVVASIAGWLDYRATQWVASVVGPLPLLVGLPVAVAEARAGNRAAALLVWGWAVNVAGMLALAGLLRGLLPADRLTLQLFQYTAILEALFWLRVLGLRIETMRRDAERVQRDREMLLSLAQTDPLTGLPNRRGLEAALAAALPGSGPTSLLAVYMIDLDGFKPINDQHGHDVGDGLLVQVGQRLRGLLRSADVVARVGGDEFVAVSTGLPAAADAQRLGAKLLAAFEQPFEVAGRRCVVGATIGYALAPAEGDDARSLLKSADAAMYAGKHDRRHGLRRGEDSRVPVTS